MSTKKRIGNVGSPQTALVDGNGLVTTWGDWSLDWWVRADDSWRVAADERGSKLSQRLVDAAPVVETTMRLGRGDVCHRAYAIAGDDELAVVELTNRSPVPIAVAFACRGAAGELRDRTMVVDGRVALVLPRAPAREEDSAFVYPLPHTATIRVLLPLVATRREPKVPAWVPSAEQVANGWRAHAGQDMRVVLPDQRLQEAFDATRMSAMLSGGRWPDRRRRRDRSTGDPFDRLHALLDAANPTWTWPDERSAAELLLLVRDVLVRDVTVARRPGLDLLSLVPDHWLGQGVEVYDVPTRHGVLSYAVRWHGERPALLWELRDHRRAVTMRIPGLDPSWSTTDPSGEALLGPVEPRAVNT